ncbi:flippase [Paraurantiacibacter namhicola]|uniref:Polysaccharide biosynthesis protein n=1 Tax=Paraurantiacibacter namhicola TaxID=645517 RepID=A0A1C7D6M7_9SPHN|nr:flippase [Paraurantiacibacter namhicola]ANU07114.1 Polysaccharide biosynthesis protein [Paraurantiacibacter namhicola]
MTGALAALLERFGPHGDVTRRILRGLAGVGGLGILHRVLGLGVALVLARHLGTYAYGQYAFATSLVAMLAVVSTFGVPPVTMRELARHHENADFGRMAGQVRAGWTYTFITVALALAVGLLVLPAGGWMAAFDRPTYLVALALVPAGAALALICGQLQGLRQAIQSSLPSLVVQPIAMLLLVVGLVLLAGAKLSAAQAMALNVATTLLALVFAWSRLRHYFPKEARAADPIAPDPQWPIVLPFVLLAGLSFINGRADVIMLGAIATPDDVGLYRVAFQGAQLVGFPLLAIGSAFAPEVAALGRKARPEALGRLLGLGATLTGLGALLAFLGAFVAGKWAIAFVLGTVYIPAWLPLMILAAANLVTGLFGPVGMLLNMQGHERRTLHAGIFSAVANVVLNAILIPPYGMVGAAAATAASMLAWNLSLGLLLRRQTGVWPGPFAWLASRGAGAAGQ